MKKYVDYSLKFGAIAAATITANKKQKEYINIVHSTSMGPLISQAANFSSNKNPDLASAYTDSRDRLLYEPAIPMSSLLKPIQGTIPTESEKRQLLQDAIGVGRDFNISLNDFSREELEELHKTYHDKRDECITIVHEIKALSAELEGLESGDETTKLSEKLEVLNDQYKKLYTEMNDSLRPRLDSLTSQQLQINLLNSIEPDILEALKGVESGFISEIPQEIRLNYSNDSKYSDMHMISISFDGSLDSALLEDLDFSKRKAERKNINFSNHHLTFDEVKQAKSESLRDTFSSIPTGDDADAAEKHTKIRISTHGSPSVLSEHAFGGDKVTGENLANLISESLPVADYRNKLTLALSMCFGAKAAIEVPLIDGEFDKIALPGLDSNPGLSILEQVAESLFKKGYRGIRLTASEVPLGTSIATYSSTNSDFLPSGTAITMVPDDETSDDEGPQDLLERYSSSPYKKTIEI